MPLGPDKGSEEARHIVRVGKDNLVGVLLAHGSVDSKVPRARELASVGLGLFF